MLCLFGLAGCATHNSVAEGSARAVSATGDLPPPSLAMDDAAPEPDYRVGPLDTIDVSVYQLPSINRTVQADSAGLISLPLIGSLNVRGKTTGEIGTDISTKLARYVRSPDVTVVVKDAVGSRVTVEGAVKQPGVYPVTARTTLLQMIATARGCEPVADERTIVVFRTVNNQRMAAAFDLKKIRSGDLGDPVIFGNDIIVVERSGSKSALRSALTVLPLAALFRPFLF